MQGWFIDDACLWCDTLWYSSLALLSSSSISVGLLWTQPFVLLSGDTCRCCCCARSASFFTILHTPNENLNTHSYVRQTHGASSVCWAVLLTAAWAGRCADSQSYHKTRYCKYPLTERKTPLWKTAQDIMQPSKSVIWACLILPCSGTSLRRFLTISSRWIEVFQWLASNTFTYSFHCGTAETGPGAEIPGLYWSAPLNFQYLTDSWL